MSATKDRGPGVFIPPPVVFIAAILLGYLFDKVSPLSSIDSYFWLLIGYTGIILSIGVLCFALLTYYKAKTHIEPWQPASKLITNGLYQYSRNPIYLTFFVLTICIGMIFSNLWIIILAVPSLWLIGKYIVAKEEAYLERTFSDKYIKYSRQVRRWL